MCLMIISKLYDSNVDMGNVENVLNTLGGSAFTFRYLGNFSGFDAALDPYCIYLVDNPRKVMWNPFFNLLLPFLWFLL